jgi:hypothetical protein
VFWPYLELAGRFSYLDAETLTANRTKQSSQTLVYEAALNVYPFANNLKVNLRYSYFDNPTAPAGKHLASNQFLAQTQWYF